MRNELMKNSFLPWFDFDIFTDFENTRKSEKDGNKVLVFDVPGIKREDLNVEVTDGYLRINGKTGDRYVNYSYVISDNYEQPSAKLEDGVLTITLTLKEQKKATKIEVK